ENNAIITGWQKSKKLTLKDKAELTRLAWGRSIQLFSALWVLLLTVVTYSVQIGMLNDRIEEQQPPAAYYPPVTPEPTNTSGSTKATPAQTGSLRFNGQHGDAGKLVPRTDNTAQIQQRPPNPMVDVFSPTATDQASYIDSLKQQYEDTLILYFIMNRCGHTLSTDYGLIMNALARDSRNAGAPEDIQANVLTAAQGSYLELYTKNACNSATMAELARQYRAYVNSLVGQ
ncbi:MAG: hypothetical protein AB7L92_05375, partial [Alphaproteobacteria bacterium]